MNVFEPTTDRRDLVVGAVVSVGAHLLVVALLVVGFPDSIEESDQPDEEDDTMEVVLDDEQMPPLPPEEMPLEEPPVPDETEESSVDQPEQQQEEVPPEDEPEDEESPEELDERIAVDQQTDGEQPDQADHVSDEAHRTDEETVADTTTLEDVEPPDETEARDQEADTHREMAMDVPDDVLEEPDIVDPEDIDDSEEDESEDEREDEEELVDDEPGPEAPGELKEYRDPEEMFAETQRPDHQETSESTETVDDEALFSHDSDRAQEMFEDVEGSERSRRTSRSGRQLLANWEDNEEQMRAALENFVPNVQPGNHTSVNAQQAAHASYIARIHRTIHANWAHDFLLRLSNNFPNHHPLNDMSLKTVVEIVIDADDGEVVETVRVEPSGNEMFDAEALNIARNVGNQPDPPDSIVSPDGRVYIHWTFWRDERQCGTFGVSIYQLRDDGQRQPVAR